MSNPYSHAADDDLFSSRFRFARRSEHTQVAKRPDKYVQDIIQPRSHAIRSPQPAHDFQDELTDMLYGVNMSLDDDTTPIATQFSLSEPMQPVTDKKQKHLRFTGLRSKLLYGMAVIVFMFGMAVGLQGWMLNRKVADQVAPPVHAADRATEPTNPDETKPDTNALANYTVAGDMPRYVRVPSLGVEARVLRMGINAAGEVATPNNVFDTGWYDGSAKPGQAGASLLVGHVSGVSSKGIFGTVDKLKPGDIIEVERGDGQKLTYKVASSQVYPNDAVDMNKALEPVAAGRQGLNLITCHGSFNASTHQYSERIVVFATQV